MIVTDADWFLTKPNLEQFTVKFSVRLLEVHSQLWQQKLYFPFIQNSVTLFLSIICWQTFYSFTLRLGCCTRRVRPAPWLHRSHTAPCVQKGTHLIREFPLKKPTYSSLLITHSYQPEDAPGYPFIVLFLYHLSSQLISCCCYWVAAMSVSLWLSMLNTWR